RRRISSLNKEVVAALARRFGVTYPARSFTAARPGGTRFRVTILGWNRLASSDFGRVVGGTFAGAAGPSVKRGFDFFQRDIELAHVAHNFVNYRCTLFL